ncbi:MAG: flagellar biosynthesis protein FlhF [Desulfobulbaceae bacterium]|nr:flagellar biosynthesis protein FlhF [Desulfobulbaceae bacterium]
MRIKRFEAPDTATALAMIKAEMGDDAVILATKTIGTSRGNIVKKGQETKVEVIAAMDYDLDALAENEPTPAAPPQPLTAAPQKKPGPARRAAGAYTPASSPPAKSVSYEPASISIAGDEKTSHLEAHDLRLRFAGMLKQHHRPDRKESPAPPAPTEKAGKPDPREVNEWRDKLIDQLLISPLPDTASTAGPTIIALVGATGVGKTTTAAKLAAWFSLHHGLTVAMLSMDCYRIGATDQLRTYAKIMRLPCEIVLRKQDMDSAIARHTDKDVIIIDTAGKSPYDQQHINELRDWFGHAGAIRPYLVLSATTKKEDLATTVASYRPLTINGLILTKIDETRTYATLCQQVVASHLPVASLCTGQRVPEDFMIASKPILARLFRRGWEAVIDERALSAARNDWNAEPQRSAS